MTAAHFLTPADAVLAHEVARGFFNKEIAEHLGISENAVKMRLRYVMAKHGVDTRIGLLNHLGWINDYPHASLSRDPNDPSDEGPLS